MNADRPIIIVAEHLSDGALERLGQVGEVRLLESCDEATLATAVADADALVVRSYAGVTAKVLRAGRRLKVVGRAGVGLELIDLPAARAQGVTVVYTPAAATQAVAEHTVGLILALERHILLGDAMVRDDRFSEARRQLLSRDLAECTAGIVGMGRIGRAVGAILRHGFGMRVLYNDIRRIGWLPFAAESVSKEVLYAESDVVTLHVPLTDLTRAMINAETLARFKPSATLINTARGAVVEARALAYALRSGKLAGAAMDVFDPEPPGADHPLRNAPNVIMSPHVAARTETGLARMNDVVDDVIAVLAGKEPAFPA